VYILYSIFLKFIWKYITQKKRKRSTSYDAILSFPSRPFVIDITPFMCRCLWRYQITVREVFSGLDPRFTAPDSIYCTRSVRLWLQLIRGALIFRVCVRHPICRVYWASEVDMRVLGTRAGGRIPTSLKTICRTFCSCGEVSDPSLCSACDVVLSTYVSQLAAKCPVRRPTMMCVDGRSDKEQIDVTT